MPFPIVGNLILIKLFLLGKKFWNLIIWRGNNLNNVKVVANQLGDSSNNLVWEEVGSNSLARMPQRGVKINLFYVFVTNKNTAKDSVLKNVFHRLIDDINSTKGLNGLDKESSSGVVAVKNVSSTFATLV